MTIRNIFKSIGALLTGLVIGIALSIGTDVLMEVTGVFPSYAEQAAGGMHVWWMLALALTYRLIYQVLACFIAAKLAPSRPMLHAMILGGVAFIVTLMGTISMWSLGDHWYPISLTVLTLPCSWLGGRFGGMYRRTVFAQ